MPWVKLDDGFLTNPKVMRAGLEGRAVYLAGLCYCAGGLTDGFVPSEALSKLGVLADVRKPSAAARTLVLIGLWELAPDGFQVHDYLKYQPSAEDVRKERVRVAEWRANKRKTTSEHSANGVLNGVRDDVLNGVPDEIGTGSEQGPRARSRPGPARPSVSPKNEDVPPNPPKRGAARRRGNSWAADADQRMENLPTGVQP